MDKKFAILGDIHANLPALRAVLDDARSQSATDFICVGDVVGYNASPCECVDIIRDLGCLTIQGNHDHYCASDEPLTDFHPLAASVVDWTRRQLSADQAAWLRRLEYQKTIPGAMFSIVHGTFDMPEQWGYVFDALDAESHFVYQKTPLCFHGHTHVPVVFEKRGMSPAVRMEPMGFQLSFGRKYFINVGSVGQPRDGNPKASYCLYDTSTRSVEFRRLDYDIAEAQALIRAAHLPERLALRLEVGR